MSGIIMKYAGITALLVFLMQMFSLHPAAAQTDDYMLSTAELDELVAPIALYPDALVAQVLPAATQPYQVVEAARYLQTHGGKLDRLPDNNWDPSVQALLETPPVLNMMNEKLSWTVKLGDAVMAQMDDVMDAIQRVRASAHAAGKLETNDKQIIIVEKEIIRIEPAQPEVIYVPRYYYVPSTSSTVYVYDSGAAFWGFTLGLILGVAITDDYFDWHHHHIYHYHYYHDRYRGYRPPRYKRPPGYRPLPPHTLPRTRPPGATHWKPSDRARYQHDARRGRLSPAQREEMRKHIERRPASQPHREARPERETIRREREVRPERETIRREREVRPERETIRREREVRPERGTIRREREVRPERGTTRTDRTTRRQYSNNSPFSGSDATRSTTRRFSERGSSSRSRDGSSRRR